MSNENERSVASAGSVAGKPVAWAALRDDGDIAWIGYTPDGAADGACCRRIVPLYRSPSLTDAEREAVEATIVDLDGGANFNEQRFWPMLAQRLRERSATLRGLLERLEGKR